MNAVLRSRLLRLAAPALFLSLVAAPTSASSAGDGRGHGDPGVVSDWNAVAGEVAIAACLAPENAPPLEARMYAMMHLAIHDALNTIDRRYERYLPGRGSARHASPEAAVAAAARGVLVPVAGTVLDPFGADCAAAGASAAEEAYAERIGAIPDGRAKSAGIAVGEAAAARDAGGRGPTTAPPPRSSIPTYPQGTVPGAWRFTPGTRLRRPRRRGGRWTRSSSTARCPTRSRTRRTRSPAGGTRRTSTRSSGSAATASRRPAPARPSRREIALFWVESSPLQWNRIARTLARDQAPGHVGERPHVRAAGRRPLRRLRRRVPGQVRRCPSGGRSRPSARRPRTATPRRPRTPRGPRSW